VSAGLAEALLWLTMQIESLCLSKVALTLLDGACHSTATNQATAAMSVVDAWCMLQADKT
jgi:hypothetical protein